MMVTMPVSKKRIQGIRNNLGGMQTEHESMLDNQIRQALDVAGNTTERPKRSWEEFDKDTQDKINKASIRLAENSYSENMSWDDGGGMDYLQQALANEDLSMNDPALQKAVADKGQPLELTNLAHLGVLAGMALLILPIAVNSALTEVSPHALTHLRNDPPHLG